MGKYVHKFDTVAQFEAVYNGSGYTEPWVSAIVANGRVDYNKSSTPNNGHAFVDLGLPSGTLWATCNVGAASPEDYGSLVSWGDFVTERSSYAWSSYPYGPENNPGKYNGTDGLTVLGADDDVAFITMGGNWHLPTTAQTTELISNTTLTTGVTNSVNCVYLTSNINGNQLVIPMSGLQNNDWGLNTRTSAGEGGAMWTVNLESGSSYKLARTMTFNVIGDGVQNDGLSRPTGLACRGVLNPDMVNGSYTRYFDASKTIYNDNGTLNSHDYYCMVTDDVAGQMKRLIMLQEATAGTGVFLSTETMHVCPTTGLTHSEGEWTMFCCVPNTGVWSEMKIDMTDVTGETTYTSSGNTYRLEYVKVLPRDGSGKELYTITKRYKNDVLIEDYINLFWGAQQSISNLKNYTDASWYEASDPDYGVCEIVKLSNPSKYYC